MTASAAMQGEGQLSLRGRSPGRSRRRLTVALRALYLGVPRGGVVACPGSPGVLPDCARAEMVVARPHMSINCTELQCLGQSAWIYNRGRESGSLQGRKVDGFLWVFWGAFIA